MFTCRLNSICASSSNDDIVFAMRKSVAFSSARDSFCARSPSVGSGDCATLFSVGFSQFSDISSPAMLRSLSDELSLEFSPCAMVSIGDDSRCNDFSVDKFPNWVLPIDDVASVNCRVSIGADEVMVPRCFFWRWRINEDSFENILVQAVQRYSFLLVC